MVIKKVDLKLYIELASIIVTSGLFLYISDSLGLDIIAFLILTIGAASIVRFNITHPYVWYSAFFTLYSLGYPILVFFDGIPLYYGYSKEVIVLHWIALVTFLIVVNPKTVNLKGIKNKFRNFECVLSRKLYIVSVFIVIGFIIFLKMKGYSSKSEIGASGSILIIFGMRFILVFILITSIELIKGIYKTNKINYRIAGTTFILLFFIFFYTAERDLVLRYILSLFFIYYVFLYNKKHKFKLLSILTTLFLLVPISKSIKYLGMRGETMSLGSNVIVDFLSSEFHTEARNVQVLLNHGTYEGYFGGKTFLTSVTNFFGITNFSTVQWFHETFYSTSKTGMGFSLVGEGYVNMGYLGVVIMFIIIGLIIKNVYRRSNKSVYNTIIFLMIIPISAYTLRADLYNFLSQYIKQVLLIVLLLKLVDEVLIRKRIKTINKVEVKNEIL